MCRMKQKYANVSHLLLPADGATGPCHAELATSGTGLGAYKPQCTATGQYKSVQCHGSTGYCWCVTSDGKEINGTRKGPGQTVTCDQGNDVTLCLHLSKHIVILVDNVCVDHMIVTFSEYCI